MNPKIAIGYPSGELVSSQFMLHMASLLMRTKLEIATFCNASSSRIAFNRNAIVDMAKDHNATHLLFADADMTFPSDALDMLYAHDLDIVGATASKRFDTTDDAIGVTLDGSRLRVPSPPIKMRLLGPCFMLIKMSVFDKLKKPYFCEPPNWMIKKEGSPDMDGIMPEDEYFCHTAIEAGLDVHCDPELSMSIGHRGAKTFYIMRPTEDLPKTPLYPFIKTISNDKSA